MKFQVATKLFLFAFATLRASSGTYWGYSPRGSNGVDELCPDEWGLAYPSCNGARQSPINIKTADTKHENRVELPGTTSSESVGLHFSGTCTSFTLKALDDSFHWNAVNNSTCSVHVGNSGSTFKLAQFHIHMLSEHTVNGVRRVGEVHFVHKDTRGKALVIAVFLERSANRIANEAALWANDVWKTLGKVNQTVEVTHPYTELLDERIAVGPVYNYPGSLTTPPCSEIVDWWVLHSPIYMSSANLNALQQQLLTLKSAFHGHDARPTQPLKNRTVIAY